MTFKEAKLLDILLKDFLIPEYVGNGSLVSITSVTNGKDKLKKLSELEIKELLNLIKSHLIKTGIPLIQGNFRYSVHRGNIKCFFEKRRF